MSAVRREQPIRLPTERGMVGALVTEASVEQLQACLAADRRWLYGGAVTVDDVTTEVLGFLTDASHNPKRYETVEEYLRQTDERSANYRAVRRAALRIEAVETELARRREDQDAETARRRDEANAKLDAWRAGLPGVVAEFHAAAEQAAKDWQLVEPFVAALDRLQSISPSANGGIRAVYAQLQSRAASLGCDPLPDLPSGVPTHDEIRHASNVLRTTEWADSLVPSTGLERLNLDRALRDARS